MVFRKVADMKKEKELAEKYNKPGDSEISQDNPVRKLLLRLVDHLLDSYAQIFYQLSF